MERQTTSDQDNVQYTAQVQLESQQGDLSDEEVGGLLAVAYPKITISSFVTRFLLASDADDRFDSDSGHVDCPIATLQAALAYQSAGGQFVPHARPEEGSQRSTMEKSSTKGHDFYDHA